MSKLTPRDRSSSVASYTPAVLVHGEGQGYCGGYIVTPHGVVGFYAQDERGRFRAYTAMVVGCHGRSYERSWERSFSQRSLKTLAKRFAASIAALKASDQ